MSDLRVDHWPQARRIGVLSDTHMPRRAAGYPEALLQAFRGVDLILHAGDLTTLRALEPLRALAPVVAVAGNTDDAAVRAALPTHRVIEAGGYRIGLTHGHLGPGATTPERARNTFSDVHVVVFGHSHAPCCEQREGVLLFNPGSPTDRRAQPLFSCGILHLDGPPWGELLTWR